MTALAYDGPFPAPSPALLQGAVGWRHISEHAPDGRTWHPVGFMVVFPDHVLRTGMDEVPYRDSRLWAAA